MRKKFRGIQGLAFQWGPKSVEAGNKDKGEKSNPANVPRCAMDVGGPSVRVFKKITRPGYDEEVSESGIK